MVLQIIKIRCSAKNRKPSKYDSSPRVSHYLVVGESHRCVEGHGFDYQWRLKFCLCPRSWCTEYHLSFFWWLRLNFVSLPSFHVSNVRLPTCRKNSANTLFLLGSVDSTSCWKVCEKWSRVTWVRYLHRVGQVGRMLSVRVSGGVSTSYSCRIRGLLPKGIMSYISRHTSRSSANTLICLAHSKWSRTK